MDNYDDAASQGGILMIFQNQQNCDNSASISKIENQCRSRKLVGILKCQKLVPHIKTKERNNSCRFPSCFPHVFQTCSKERCK